MFDLPLHPIAVHFPIAIGMLMPLLILIVIFGHKKWNWPRQIWNILVVLQFVCVVSSFVAVNLGEKDEDRIKSSVSSEMLEEHEELGEKVPWTSGILFLVMLVPLFAQRKQKVFMAFSLACSLGLCVHLIVTGHTGGKLVYSSEKSVNSMISDPEESDDH